MFAVAAASAVAVGGFAVYKYAYKKEALPQLVSGAAPALAPQTASGHHLAIGADSAEPPGGRRTRPASASNGRRRAAPLMAIDLPCHPAPCVLQNFKVPDLAALKAKLPTWKKAAA